MNFLITMAGRGQRFTDAGYTIPKWKIEAHGLSLLEWSVNSLPLKLATKLIFVCLKEHIDNFDLVNFVHQRYKDKVPQIEFVELNEVTRGQAETALLAKPVIDIDKPLLIFNIDTRFVSPELGAQLLKNVDAVLGAFRSQLPHFSYARLDDDQQYVVQTAEKEVISEYALTGMYHFTDPADFYEAAEHTIQNNITVNNEFYIAPMYNYCISKGKKIIIDVAETVNILGTPAEVNLFKSMTI